MTRKKTVKAVVLKGSVKDVSGERVLADRIGEFDEATAKEAVRRGKLSIQTAAPKPDAAKDGVQQKREAAPKPENDQNKDGAGGSPEPVGEPPRL